jgi:hypothetical protein
MIFLNDTNDPILQLSHEELIEQVCYRTGFTSSDIKILIDSELEIDHVLDYLTSVVSNRMN